ncbi:MAG: outer membrane protein transport protein [Rhodothermia bacterium]|nr:MAG: outer membrane protein transport protein [Rhodothermia bacterium]
MTLKTYAFPSYVKSIGFALIGCFAFLAPATAQNGNDALRFSQRFPGTTAASVGISGTGIAGVADPSALILNPAGLGFARTSSISGSFSSFEIQDDSFYQMDGSSFPGTSELTSSGVGNFATLYKIPTSQGSLVLGASFSQITTYERNLFFEGENGLNSITDFFMPLQDEFELNEEGDDLFPEFFRTPSFIAFETFAIDFDQGLFEDNNPIPFLPAVSTGTVAQSGSVTEEGRMNELNIGGAMEAAKGVMIGASINIPFARYTFTRIFKEEDIFDDNDGSGGTTDFDYLEYSESFQSDMVGINARLGLSAKVSPQMRLGFTIETPTELTIDEDFDTVLRTEFDNGDVFTYGDQADENEGSGRFEYTLTTPWRVGAGVSFRSGSFTLMADAEWVDWSQMEFSSDNGTFFEENRSIREQFDGVLNTRIGATYEAGDFILRGGFAVYPDPQDRRFAQAADGTVVDRERQYFSLGLGYRISTTLRADAGWMQEQFDDVYSPYTEVANAPIVAEEVIRNRFQIGFTYRL